MFICILSSPPDENDIPYDPSGFLKDFRWEHHILRPHNLEDQLRTLSKRGFDVFINLCDGTPDDGLPGVGLVQMLEQLGVAFTGADSSFFDPTRVEMKQAAARADVPVPGSAFARNQAEVQKVAEILRFPLIVKPPHGYASVGLKRESRVTSPETLQEQAARTIQGFSSTLIEEFVDGREFTVLIVENPDDAQNPRTFKPVEFIFPSGESFKHYDLKWKEYRGLQAIPVGDTAIEKRLRYYTKRLFLAMKGNGYARCDYRMNSTGKIVMLEINPNCGIFYPLSDPGSADFVLLNDPFGHSGFLNLIIRQAVKRRERAILMQTVNEFASKI